MEAKTNLEVYVKKIDVVNKKLSDILVDFASELEQYGVVGKVTLSLQVHVNGAERGNTNLERKVEIDIKRI